MLPPVKGPSANTPVITASPIPSGAAFFAAAPRPAPTRAVSRGPAPTRAVSVPKRHRWCILG